MRHPTACGRGLGTGDARGGRKKGSNVQVRAVALGLLLAVLSPLVVSGSPTSADGPATTTTVVGVDPVVVTQPGVVTFSASVAPISNGGTPSQYADDLGQVAFYGAGGLLPICRGQCRS